MNTNKSWLPDISLEKGTWRDDWRIMGQEGYLLKKSLQHIVFDLTLCKEDFRQCEFCGERFKDQKDSAYFQPDEKVWVCETCFEDFCKPFQWTVE